MEPIMTMDVVELVARLLISSLYVFSAIRKIKAPRATRDAIAAAKLPVPALAYVVAIAIDVLGAASMIAGLLVRWFAAVLAVFTFVLAFTFHGDIADRNQSNHFMKNFCVIGGLLLLVAHGAGKLSLDRWLGIW